MTNRQNPPNRRPPMPTLHSEAARTQPVQRIQQAKPSERFKTDFDLPTQQSRPVTPKLPAQSKANPAAPKRTSRHTMRVALATGTTIAVLLGTQALAIFGRTADANPVIVGASADTGTNTSSSATQVVDVPTDISTDVPSDTPIATNTSQPRATSTSTATLTNTTAPSKTPANTSAPHPTVKKYTVLGSDTLGAIAAKFNTTTSTIMSLNSSTLKNRNILSVGQVLLVPGPLSLDPISPTPTATITNTPSSTSTVKPPAPPRPTSTPKPTIVYVAPVVQPAPVTRSSHRG